MIKVVKKVGTVIVNVLIVALVLFSVIISISSITAKSNNGVPDLFGYSPFSVQTDSMSPTINEGDYIFIEKCDADELKKNDIVTYFTIIDGQRVVNTHRIVNVINNDGIIQYQTQGDNRETNPAPDEVLLSPGDVIGKYTNKKIPVMGTVIDYLSTQTGFFLVILLPVLLYTLYQIYKLVMIVLYNHKVDTLNAMSDSASEEVKEAIIAEYLAKQQDELSGKHDKNKTKAEKITEETKEKAEDNND